MSMTNFSFKPLSIEHIDLLHKWMQEPHVSQWWGEGRSWSFKDIKEKYTPYTLGYKIQQGTKNPICPFVIELEERPIGFVQFYNALDFPRDGFNVENVWQDPTILKLEDLDGGCHIIEGYDEGRHPIYSEKAIAAGMTPAYGTPEEIIKWLDCLQRKDLEGLAQVRFPQDILSIGITLYQLLTGDIDLDNIYLNMERTPRNNKPGEDGEFKSGMPNIESIRLALEDYKFLTGIQKDAIVKVIAHAITLNPSKRAKLQDLEAAMTVL